jgi:hypothetical protein
MSKSVNQTRPTTTNIGSIGNPSILALKIGRYPGARAMTSYPLKFVSLGKPGKSQESKTMVIN